MTEGNDPGFAPSPASGHQPGRSWHDMGGDPAGAIDPATHDYALWEKRVDALMVLLTTKGHFTVDGLRRALEAMGPDAFETMTYYERWIAAVTENAIETGAITIEDLNARMEAVAARGPTYGAAQAPKSGE
ncbi:MAG: ScnB-like protein [Pseudomonadota bacterium]